ncbi:MAG: carboxyltransferase domain-containing protein, partial [Pseudomonadota bacterium]
HDAVRALAQAALKRIEKAQPGPETQREVQGEAREGGRTWCVPVCYEQSEFAPDLGAVAATLGLSPQEVVARHTSVTLRVLMVGFLPGLPYLGPVDPTLVLPRRAAPRTHVPALSVGLAAGMSVIYPRASPGGWHLLGRTPVPIFDLDHEPPGVFAAGDRVMFRAVSMAKYQELADRVAAGEPGAAVLADFAQDEAVA